MVLSEVIFQINDGPSLTIDVIGVSVVITGVVVAVSNAIVVLSGGAQFTQRKLTSSTSKMDNIYLLFLFKFIKRTPSCKFQYEHENREYYITGKIGLLRFLNRKCVQQKVLLLYQT